MSEDNLLFTSTAVITVCGIEKAGLKSVDFMVQAGLEQVSFVVLSSNAETLTRSPAKTHIHIDVPFLSSVSEIFHQTGIEEIRNSFDESLSGKDMVVLIAHLDSISAMKTLAAAARVAREDGALTLVMARRSQRAYDEILAAGMSETLMLLAKYADSFMLFDEEQFQTMTWDLPPPSRSSIASLPWRLL